MGRIDEDGVEQAPAFIWLHVSDEFDLEPRQICQNTTLVYYIIIQILGIPHNRLSLASLVKLSSVAAGELLLIHFLSKLHASRLTIPQYWHETWSVEQQWRPATGSRHSAAKMSRASVRSTFLHCASTVADVPRSGAISLHQFGSYCSVYRRLLLYYRMQRILSLSVHQ